MTKKKGFDPKKIRVAGRQLSKSFKQIFRNIDRRLTRLEKKAGIKNKIKL